MLAAWYHSVLFVMFFVTCILLILIVLLQKGRGGGLGAAFGGAGSSAFGARTGDVLTWVTIVLTAMFLLLAVGTTMVFRPTDTNVAAPVFDPLPPGNIGEDTEVSLGTEIAGATIWYQVNDSEPAQYHSDRPIPVPAGSTLTAWATREGWTPSERVQKVYGEPELQLEDLLPQDVLLPGTMPLYEPPDAPGPAEPTDVTPGTDADQPDHEGDSDDSGETPDQ